MGPEVVIVPKLTIVEWEARARGVDYQTLAEQWSEEGVDVGKNFASHKRQIETIEKLGRALGVPVLHRDAWTPEIAKYTRIVFVPGGDNHFQHVGRFIYGDQIVVSLNSDPKESKGGILPFWPEDIDYIKDCLDHNSFRTERWTRLQAVLEGEKLPFYALSEILVAEVKSRGMNRNILNYRGITEVHKGSGFVVATGAGLTGYYKNVTDHWDREIQQSYPLFSKTAKRVRFISVNRDIDSGSLDIGDLDAEEELVIRSLNKNGEISFDPDPNDDRFSFPFKRGSELKISIALDHPLTIAVKEGGDKYGKRSVNYG